MRKYIPLVLAAVFAGALMQGHAEDAGKNSDQKKKWKIALSNSYYGNIWRRQMVEAFKEAAEKAKADGLISDYYIENGDGTVNQQNSQLSSLILKGVDAIAINAASPTALNGVIDKACQAGIKVVAFDSIATADCAYKLDFDMVGIFGGMAEYIAKDLLHGKGDVLLVRGVQGSAPDKIISDAQKEVLNEIFWNQCGGRDLRTGNHFGRASCRFQHSSDPEKCRCRDCAGRRRRHRHRAGV